MNKRLWLYLLLVFALTLTACQPAATPTPAATATSAPVAAPPTATQPAATEPTATQPAAAAPTATQAAATQPAATATVAKPAAGAGEVHTAWPYQAPPTGHYNTFVPDGLSLGIYQTLMEPPLFMYMWADDDWLPIAGKSWEWTDDTTLRVHLQEGAVWSDSSKFTSQDVVDTFDIARLQNLAVWRFLKSVDVVDDVTVDFKLNEPSTTVPRRVLRETFIRASSTYGDFAKRVRDLVTGGKNKDSAEWKSLLDEFNKFRPDDMVVLGPFKIDQNSITESQMILNKVPTSFMADWVKFDKILNYNGETPDVTPLVLAGDVDYATHGFPPATEDQFKAQGIRIIRAPLYTGPALYFNHKVHPFELVQFRQAVAYVIDRDQNGTVSLSESGKRQMWMTGFSDNLVANWLTDDTKAKLNKYDVDLKKAEELLTGVGFTRDTDQVWKDDKGKRLEFELTAPAEFADWSAAAENVAEQLTAFGIKTTFRGVNFQQHPVDVRAGNFQMAIRDWGAGNPHPHFAFDIDFNSYNTTGGSAQATAGPGMSFALKQKTAMGDLDLGALTDQAGKGGKMEDQKSTVNQLALAYNELLPQIPLWERYGNNPAQETRITGWPADGDKIYQNGPYGDPFFTVLLITGKLTPK